MSEQEIPKKKPLARTMYSEEEARQILDRAMGLQLHGREFSQSHLVQMAEDLGITEEQLQAAEESWLADRVSDQERHQYIRVRHQEFKKHLMIYAIVNTFIFLLNIVLFIWLRIPVPFFIFPLLGWGIAVAINAWEAYQTEGDEFERAFLSWRKKQRLRQQLHRELLP